MNAFREDRLYTYKDYMEWATVERYELIDGVPYMMAAPTWEHQAISGELFGQLHEFLKGKSCKVFHAPFDVRFNAFDDDNIVVQPDIVVICDRSKLSGTGCKGAPDMIIEILSASSLRMDKLIKFIKYRNSGVREYWIIDPESKTVQVCTLENENYITSMYSDTDIIPVHVLDGCHINMQDVFAE